MEEYRSKKLMAMCPSSCSKCFRIRNVIDLRNLETKYERNKDEMPDVNKEHGRSYLNITERSNMKTREVTKETNKYGPKCPLCKLLLPQIRNLVRDISIVDIKDIPGICRHCKNINSTLQCERCDYILKSYMQEKECYVDHCNKECHEVIARIKTLLSEFEKHDELMKLKSLSLDELLKYLKPLKKGTQQKGQHEIDGGIQGGTQGFRSSCVCEDLLKKLQEKMANIDYENYGKFFTDSKTPSYQRSHGHLDKTKKIKGKQKSDKSFIDSEIPSYDFSHDQLENTKSFERKQKLGRPITGSKLQSPDISYDQLEKSKMMERNRKYGKSFIDGKTPLHEIDDDQLEKSKMIERKDKYGKSFIDGETPSPRTDYNQLGKSKIIGRKHKNDKSFIDGKTPSRRIDHDQIEKSKIMERKHKYGKSFNDGKRPLHHLSHDDLEKAMNIGRRYKKGEISKTKDGKDAIDLNYKDKRKPDFKKTVAKDVNEQYKRDKKTKNKKQSDKLKENEFGVDLKKIKGHNKSLDQLEKMMSKQKKRKRDPQYNIKKLKIPVIGELPPLRGKKFKEHGFNDSDSTIVCEHADENDFIEVIEGNRIVRYKRGQSRDEPKTKKPLFFNVTHNFSDESLSDINLGSPTQSEIKSARKDELFGKYRLSNRKYIENGWTVLPTLTFVRRLSIYKMIPTESTFDWLGRHKNEDLIFYETGEVLAEVYDDGLFKWFYRDGNVALDFIDVFDEETNATKEYIVYDTVTKNKRGYDKKIQTLASFDDKGHGVVYDRFGSARIKYNQDEGVLFDRHIGSPCHWKWNTLNDPPKIQVEQIFEFLTPLDPYIEKLEVGVENDKREEISSLPRSQIKITTEFEDERNEVELKNVIREKSMKILMNYKPFEIRSKIFKLNDHFSLRLLGQSKIYILFRDDKVSLKLNVGMKLISNEVIDIKFVNNDIIHMPEQKYENNRATDFQGSNSSLS